MPVPPDDAAFVAEVLARHPSASVKIGCGIAWFTTATTGGRHFVIVRTDGSRTDFSWKECVSPSSHRQRVQKAMRSAITPQISAFRDSQEPLACALDATHPGPYHVDHEDPSFITMANRFAEAKGGYASVLLRPHRDGDVNAELINPDLATWLAYHQLVARLRILCQACNCNGARS